MKAKAKLSGGDLQDGMLAYYLSQAGMADANVEATIEKEPFDFRDILVTSRPHRYETCGITPKWRRESGNL